MASERERRGISAKPQGNNGASPSVRSRVQESARASNGEVTDER